MFLFSKFPSSFYHHFFFVHSVYAHIELTTKTLAINFFRRLCTLRVRDWEWVFGDEHQNRKKIGKNETSSVVRYNFFFHYTGG